MPFDFFLDLGRGRGADKRTVFRLDHRLEAGLVTEVAFGRGHGIVQRATNEYFVDDIGAEVDEEIKKGLGVSRIEGMGQFLDAVLEHLGGVVRVDRQGQFP